MTHLLGGSVKSWFKGLFHWRVAPRWYLFAIGVPIALAVLVTAEFAVFGKALDWSLLDNRLIAFLPALLVTALVGGGNEEPGWRGFAMPRLQDRYSPVRSTLVLGVLWAPWHLPILLATDDASHGLATGGVLVLAALTLLSIVGYAFAYTYLLNKTGIAWAKRASRDWRPGFLVVHSGRRAAVWRGTCFVANGSETECHSGRADGWVSCLCRRAVSEPATGIVLGGAPTRGRQCRLVCWRSSSARLSASQSQ